MAVCSTNSLYSLHSSRRHDYAAVVRSNEETMLPSIRQGKRPLLRQQGGTIYPQRVAHGHTLNVRGWILSLFMHKL